ncbi:hypothetical protein GOB43_17920 [Sinorhizobium meliloti]|nr:hypothetical protein [Sinorhizobium meliloti]MDX0194069.1 hypothetical protein [Sinorhizobium meliloti]
MIEKITHIRNPLTVIAVFAGLAEVSGTVVLPFLSPETQEIYVLFLMFFPILLVGLFFAVLYWKHHVLYAPSDYRTDETFRAMFVAATPFARIRKYEGEVEAISLGDPIYPQADAMTHLGDPISVEVDEGLQSALAESPAPAPAPVTEEELSDRQAIFEKRLEALHAKSVFASAFLIEELAVAQLETQMNVKFDRNVSPQGMPGLVFDGVWSNGVKTIVVDITYIRAQSISPIALERRFAAVAPYFDRLSKASREQFELVAVFVIEDYSSEAAAKLTQIGHKVSSRYPFKSVINAWSADYLRGNLREINEGVFG